MVLETMDEFEAIGASFAVETKLASRSLATRIRRLRRSGYRFHLVFVWAPDPDFSVRRVASRVRAGGHHIPEETIRRRYLAGIRNFFGLYQPIADAWDVLDNSGLDGPRRIASGRAGAEPEVLDLELWTSIRQGGTHEPG